MERKNRLHLMRGADAIPLLVGILVAVVHLSCVTNLEEQRKEVESYKRIAAEYMAENDYTSALKTLLKAEKIYAEDPELQNYLGYAYIVKNRYDLAETHLIKAIELRPNYSVAKNNLATVYMDLKQWDHAVSYLKEVAEDLTYETPHRVFSNLGWIYYNKRAYREAEDYYRKALAYQSKFVLAIRGLALTLIATARYSEAADYLERAVSLAPHIPHLYYDMAEAYSLSGRYEQARRSYDKVIELVPGSPLAAEAGKQKTKIIGR